MWPGAAAYFGVNLDTPAARETLVARVGKARDFIFDDTHQQANFIDEAYTNSARDHVKALNYFAGETYRSRYEILAKYAQVSSANTLGRDWMAQLVQNSADVPATTESVRKLLGIASNENVLEVLSRGVQPRPADWPYPWPNEPLWANITRPEHCIDFGGMLTNKELAGNMKTDFTEIPAVTLTAGDETLPAPAMTLRNLQTFCVVMLVDVQRADANLPSFETPFEKRRASPTEPIVALPPTPVLPPNQTLLYERIKAKMADPKDIAEKKERSIRANARVKEWYELFNSNSMMASYRDVWDANARQTIFSKTNSLYHVITAGDYMDPATDNDNLKAMFVPGSNTQHLEPDNPDHVKIYLKNRTLGNLIDSFSYEGGPGYRALTSLQAYSYTVPILEFYEQAHKAGHWHNVLDMPMLALARRISGENSATYSTLTLLDNYVGLAKTTGIESLIAAGLRAAQTPLYSPFDTIVGPLAALASVLQGYSGVISGLAVTLMSEVGWAILRKWYGPDWLPTIEDIFKNEQLFIDGVQPDLLQTYAIKRLRMVYAYRARQGLNKLLGLVYSSGIYRNVISFAVLSWLLNAAFSSPINPIGPAVTSLITGSPDYTLLTSAISLIVVHMMISAIMRLGTRTVGKVPYTGSVWREIRAFLASYMPSPFIFLPTIKETVVDTYNALFYLLKHVEDPINTPFADLLTSADMAALFPPQLKAVFQALYAKGNTYRPDQQNYPDLNFVPKMDRPSTAPGTQASISFRGFTNEGAGGDSSTNIRSYAPATRRLDDWLTYQTLSRAGTLVSVEEEAPDPADDELSEYPQPMALSDMMLATYRGGSGDSLWHNGSHESASIVETYIGMSS